MRQVQMVEKMELHPGRNGEGAGGPLRIAQVIRSGVWGDMTPDALQRGLGGRETAVLHLGHQWASKGHEVMHFVNVERGTTIDGVTYMPLSLAHAMLSSTPWDVVVSWEDPVVFCLDGVAESSKVRLIGLQVAHMDIDSIQASLVDGYVCLSNWAADLFSHDSGITRDQIFVVPNGIDLNRYPPPHGVLGKKLRDLDHGKPLEAFYSSSPDRGLHHLLRIWPRVRKEISSEARLSVAYGARRWVEQMKWSHLQQGEIARMIDEGLNQDGVRDVGLIGQDDLARLQSASHILPYTCDTMSPTETGCITVVEAMAAMTPVITTDCDCLPSEYDAAARIVDLPFDDDAFLGHVEDVVKNADIYEGLALAGRKLAEGRTWDRTSDQWLAVMRERLLAYSTSA